MGSKANPLLSSSQVSTRPWRQIKLRTICGCRSSANASSTSAVANSETRVAGKKILETHTEEFDVGSQNITLEIGKLARFANGAVLLAMEETKVLSTVSSCQCDETRDFLPLTVCVYTLRLQIRRQSTIELQNFKERWEEAIGEDEN